MNRGAENAPEPQPASASGIQSGVDAYQPDESALRGASLEVVPPGQAPQPEPTGQLHTTTMLIRDFYCCQTRMEGVHLIMHTGPLYIYVAFQTDVKGKMNLE